MLRSPVQWQGRSMLRAYRLDMMRCQGRISTLYRVCAADCNERRYIITSLLRIGGRGQGRSSTQPARLQQDTE